MENTKNLSSLIFVFVLLIGFTANSAYAQYAKSETSDDEFLFGKWNTECMAHISRSVMGLCSICPIDLYEEDNSFSIIHSIDIVVEVNRMLIIAEDDTTIADYEYDYSTGTIRISYDDFDESYYVHKTLDGENQEIIFNLIKEDDEAEPKDDTSIESAGGLLLLKREVK